MKIYLQSSLCGVLSVLSFAPFDLFPLIFICLAALLLWCSRASVKEAFLLGLSYGLGQYLVGVSWVYVSLSTYGGMPLWMGSIAVLGFALLMSLFIAITLGLSVWLSRHSGVSIFWVIPPAWTVFEWCKSWVFTGFPWLDLGYSQTQSWLFHLAPIGGVYMISFWVLLCACCLASFIRDKRVVSLAMGFILLLSPMMLTSIDWVETDGEPLSVGVIQINVPIETKWNSDVRDLTIKKYQSLSNELASRSDMDLLIWPETALPVYLSQTDTQFWEALLPSGVAVVSGLLDHEDDDSYNAAVLVCENQRDMPQVYRKSHLVPFGEYQPLQFLFGWVFEYLDLPMSGFTAWHGNQKLDCGGSIRLGLSICYEDTFADEYRQSFGDSNVLVNISEDAWFGDSLAPHQRRQLAQMRAKELGRPMIRSANSGPSLFVDHQGVVIASTPQFEVASLVHTVHPKKGQTPFSALGLWIVWLSILTLILLSIGAVASRHKGSKA